MPTRFSSAYNQSFVMHLLYIEYWETLMHVMTVLLECSTSILRLLLPLRLYEFNALAQQLP